MDESGFRISPAWAGVALIVIGAWGTFAYALSAAVSRIGSLEQQAAMLRVAIDTIPPTQARLHELDAGISNLEGQLQESRADRAQLHAHQADDEKERVKLGALAQSLQDTIVRIENNVSKIDAIHDTQIRVLGRLDALEHQAAKP